MSSQSQTQSAGAIDQTRAFDPQHLVTVRHYADDVGVSYQDRPVSGMYIILSGGGNFNVLF